MGSEGLPPPPSLSPSPVPSSRRSYCSRCTKPSRLCLCARLKYPPLDNLIAVTVLQHSLEASHPLNSTRVARLGFRNMTVVTVTDVNFHANLLIRPLTSDSNVTQLPSSADSDGKVDLSDNTYDEDQDRLKSDLLDTQLLFSGGKSMTADSGVSNSFSAEDLQIRCEFIDPDEDYEYEADLPKFRVKCSLNKIVMEVERGVQPDMRKIAATSIGRSVVKDGFLVKKLQRKQIGCTDKFKDFIEFEIVVPPGSALLYPSDKSVKLEAVDFEVKHLLVLDGTWAKAKRIYHENPWLKLLPHVKLNVEKESLYSEVRHQPKLGYLSTIESIVCAMKGLGGDMDGLDGILDVFGSMISDQRRCKDENFQRSVSLC